MHASAEVSGDVEMEDFSGIPQTAEMDALPFHDDVASLEDQALA